MKIAPEPGEIVHVGPLCFPAVVFYSTPGRFEEEIYVRVMVPKKALAPSLTWGGLMEVQAVDLEGWVAFGKTANNWHWPERRDE